MMIYLAALESKSDEPKFIRLYNKYKNLVFYIAKQKLNNHELAEDCVQDTFLYIAKNFKKIGEIDNASTKCYVSTIATGMAISILRREIKNSKIIEKAETEVSEEYTDDDFDIFDSVELSYAIDKLSEEQKNLVYLKYVCKCTSKEIGKIYKISDSLARMRIHDAMKILRENMKGSAVRD